MGIFNMAVHSIFSGNGCNGVQASIVNCFRHVSITSSSHLLMMYLFNTILLSQSYCLQIQ